jgi:AraC family transcriptional regulator
MTQNLAITTPSDGVALGDLFAKISGLLENSAEPAEHRVRQAGALLRSHPYKLSRAADPSVVAARHPSLPAWQIKRLMDHIDSNIDASISIQDLAGVAKLSPSHFCRAFRASLNETPHCFVMRRRVARSQALMSTTRAPLSHIAVDCGFADQAHFSRVHRRLVGVAPGLWRRTEPTYASLVSE